MLRARRAGLPLGGVSPASAVALRSAPEQFPFQTVIQLVRIPSVAQR